MTKFEIYPVTVDQGQIALSPLPGRFGPLRDDVGVIADWAPALVLTLVEQAELDHNGVADLGDHLQQRGIAWRHVSVPDYQTPDADSDLLIDDAVQEAALILSQGGRVLVHCFGGCGRSGMVALRIMIAVGEAPDPAFNRLRLARPCAVETADQLVWAQSI